MKQVFHLPDLGEGLPDAEVVEWHVQVGDIVKVDEPLASMETAKAVVEVPSPYAGTVMVCHGEKGAVIKTGAPLVTFDLQALADTGTVAGKLDSGEAQSEPMPTQPAVMKKPISTTERLNNSRATPAVRALAQTLGVTLAQVTPTGPNNTITRADVTQASAVQQRPPGDWVPLKGVRRAMAHSMQASHHAVVPVTLFDEVDITTWVKSGDITVRLIQAISAGVIVEPALNALYHGDTESRQLMRSLNLGLAVDTDEGLFVPVIPGCEAQSGQSLRTQIEALKVAVKARTVPPEQLKGHSFVLSNFGKFAGRYATPIVLPPAVAILGVGRLREGWAMGDTPTKATLLPLSLTFDHRAVTGGEASRFLGAVMMALSEGIDETKTAAT